jgi:hypothetical protein
MTPDASPPKKRRRWKKILAILLITPIILCVLYMLFVLNWSYSTGERAGYVQKFSRKGVLFKTWEGELAMVNLPGTAPEKFYFTVREDSVAHFINGLMGQQVVLTYDQHIGIPTSLFGETEYFVVRARPVGAHP